MTTTTPPASPPIAPTDAASTPTPALDRLWAAIDPIHRSILAHPFLRGLTDGTLPDPVFRYYVVQDALYLGRYARALAVAAARAPNDPAVAMFAEHAAGALAVERALHEGFLPDLGLSPHDVAATPLAPTNLAYTSYLLATAHAGSFAEALGALLPCYWIYWEVGKTLLDRGSPNPMHQRWIDTYGGDDYAAVVQAVLALADRLLPTLSPTDLDAMTRHLVATARYEWMFWDAAWRLEPWPIAPDGTPAPEPPHPRP